jgi:hypothetical protein
LGSYFKFLLFTYTKRLKVANGMARCSWNCVYVNYSCIVHYEAQPNVRFEVMILSDMKVIIILEAIYNDCWTLNIKLLVGLTFD